MPKLELKNLSDKKLFNLTQKGNELAFTTLFKRHWQALYRSIQAFISDSRAAEDIVQDIFSTIWSRREEIQTDDIVAYLFKAAKFQSFKYIRDKKPTQSLVEKTSNLAFAFDTEDKINFSQVKEQYESCLKTMPDKSKVVFELSRIENLSNHEISEKLQITIKTVEYHMRNALKHLRSNMTEFISALLFINLL